MILEIDRRAFSNGDNWDLVNEFSFASVPCCQILATYNLLYSNR